MKAVVWTDVFQAIVILAGLLAIVIRVTFVFLQISIWLQCSSLFEFHNRFAHRRLDKNDVRAKAKKIFSSLE